MGLPFRLPFRMKGVVDINYNIDIDEDQYAIALDLKLAKTWYMQAIGSLQKVHGKDVGLLPTWEVESERLRDTIAVKFQNVFKKVTYEVQKDIPKFKILSIRVSRVKFTTVGNYVETRIEVNGICQTE